MSKTPCLSVNLCGVELKNPVIAASGTFGSVSDYSRYLDINKLGGISVKGITLHPRKGNPPPRIAETPSGILNSVGLQNPGVDHFIVHQLPQFQRFGTRIIANINGDTIEEYAALASKLDKHPVDMLEVNISCPNVKAGGALFGSSPDMVYSVTSAVRRESSHPLIVKLTPNTTDITETALAAQEAGCNCISMINTLLGMSIDVDTRRPVLGNVTGGLSGPAVMPIALRMVWQTARVVDIPIIGMGGIMSGRDAAAFLLAGASCVSVGSASLVNPAACIDILEGLVEYMEEQGVESVDSLVGGLIA